MIIRRQTIDQNLIINTETDFQTDLGWEDNLMQFEEEILNEIINPIENYETVRYIHKPYFFETGATQTDIWFYFYFNTGGTYNQDYQSVGITNQDNEHLLAQSTKSFFRLEFYKTPGTVTNNVLTCDPPTRQNRKLVFAKNLSLPNGEKVFDSVLNGHLHIPIFTGSNYRNKENMYMFWFEDESVLTETVLSGTTTLDRYTFNNTGLTKNVLFTDSNNNVTQIVIPTGITILSGATNQTFTLDNVNVSYNRNYYHGMNTFFMTAKFYDAENGSIYDFTNNTGYTHVNESQDMYYQVDIDKVEHTYSIYKYATQKSTNRFGTVSGSTITPITFYQK